MLRLYTSPFLHPPCASSLLLLPRQRPWIDYEQDHYIIFPIVILIQSSCLSTKGYLISRWYFQIRISLHLRSCDRARRSQ